MWWGGHLDLMEHDGVVKGWEGWALYPNVDIVTWFAIENQRPLMQKSLFRERLVPTFIRHIVIRFSRSSNHFSLLPFTQWLMSSMQDQNYVGTWLLEQNFFGPL